MKAKLTSLGVQVGFLEGGREDVEVLPIKNKKGDEAEIPTHLWLRWLNDGTCKVISEKE